jgi:hypothetical protein
MVNQALTLDEVLEISEQLKPSDRLRLISMLSERLRREIEQGAELVDMLSLAGVGADLWAEIDAAAYLEQERAMMLPGDSITCLVRCRPGTTTASRARRIRQIRWPIAEDVARHRNSFQRTAEHD